MGWRIWWIFDFDDAGLAGGHAAGHGLFEADLAVDLVLGGEFGDGVHHGVGAAGVDDGLGWVGELAIVWKD